MEIVYNKLIRDKVPELIKEKGKTPVVYKAEREEYRKLLKDKLVEEAKEFKESGNVNELADVLEVVDCILDTDDISVGRIAELRRQKREKRGSFEKKIVLKKVIK